MIWLFTGCFGGTVQVPDAKRVESEASSLSTGNTTPTSPTATGDTGGTPPASDSVTTGDTGAVATALCPGITPREIYFTEQTTLGLTPALVVMGEVEGPGVVCDVKCDAAWVSGRWTAPAGLDPLPLPYELAIDEHVELLLDVDHVGGLHDATCQAMVGGDLVVEVSVRQ